MKPSILILSGLLITSYCIAKPINGGYWQCTTKDRTSKQWTITNAYQKIALNLSYEACKKESHSPESCTTSLNDCEGFQLGMSTSPYWRCTALDRTAGVWQSNYYRVREDAALAAEAYCKNNSTVPDTCYINMVTCKNINEGS